MQARGAERLSCRSSFLRAVDRTGASKAQGRSKLRCSVGLRGLLGIPPKLWRVGHTGLAVVIVIGSVVHAVLVEGSMGMVSKAAFCVLVLAALARVVTDLRVWTLLTRRSAATASPSGQGPPEHGQS